MNEIIGKIDSHGMLWLETTGKVMTNDGERLMPIFITESIPGMCIAYAGLGVWSLTHLESGRGAHGGFALLDDAMFVAAKTAPMLDWTTIKVDPGSLLPEDLKAAFQEMWEWSVVCDDRIDLMSH